MQIKPRFKKLLLFYRATARMNHLERMRYWIFNKLGYVPHEGQARFHDSKARFKVLAAGTRYGKSFAAAKDVLVELMKGNTRGWIVGPSYRLAEKELRYILDDLTKLGVPFKKRSLGGHNGPSHVVLAWGAELHVVSTQNPHTLLGEELDWMLLSEGAQIKEETFTRILRGRLTTRGGRLIIPTTPKGFNWVHDCFLRGPDPAHPDWESFQFATAENPLIPPEEIEEAQRTLPKEIFEEQFLGAFTALSGLVYPEFDLALHVEEREIKPEEIPREQRFASIDFGYRNPFALLYGIHSADNCLYIYDEYYAQERTVDEHFQTIGLDHLRKQQAVFADPSAPGNIAQLQKAGCAVESAKNNVLFGIDALRTRLKASHLGKPSLVVHPRCTNLIREFSRYSWEESDGEPNPLKRDDHALDALRYLVMGVESKSSAEPISRSGRGLARFERGARLRA